MYINIFKNSVMIIITLFSINYIDAIEKPKIRIGINSYEYYKITEEEKSLYPSTISDNLFFSIEEKLSNFFKYKHKIDFFTYDYNKYSSNLENLKSIVFNNTLDLFFIPQNNNEFKLTTKPMLYYKYGEINLKLMNRIQYKLNLKDFLFKTYYSHFYNFDDDELFYHNMSFAFYWDFPKYNFIKFKTEVSIYLQHYTQDFNDLLKEISFIKSAKFNFEIAIDFNKIDFEDVFYKNEKEDDFFNDEEIN